MTARAAALPLLRLRLPFLFPRRATAPHLTRVMSSSSSATAAAPGAAAAAKKHEWLVIVPDRPGALQTRVSVREQHLAGVRADDAGSAGGEDSFWQVGGALLAEPVTDGATPKMEGSMMVCLAASKEEVLARLRRDVYVTGGVWDLDRAQVWPFRSAIRKGI